MESSIYYKRRIIRTNSNVLRTHQLTGDLPNDDEYNLPRSHHKWKYDSIHGRYGHPYNTKGKRNRGRTHSTTLANCEPSTRQTRRTQPIPQPQEMRLRTTIHQLSRSTRCKWHSTNGTRKSRKSTKLDTTTKCNQSSMIPRVHRILSVFHTRILTNCPTAT